MKKTTTLEPEQRPFRLGPLQKEWIRCLRSGRFKQARSCLIAIPDDAKAGDELPCCCLGVACLVAEANGVRLRFEESVLSLRIYDGGIALKGQMPRSVTKKLKFRDTIGSFENRCRHVIGLIDANDIAGWSFKRIANYVEKHPENVFTGSA